MPAMFSTSRKHTPPRWIPRPPIPLFVSCFVFIYVCIYLFIYMYLLRPIFIGIFLLFIQVSTFIYFFYSPIYFCLSLSKHQSIPSIQLTYHTYPSTHLVYLNLFNRPTYQSINFLKHKGDRHARVQPWRYGGYHEVRKKKDPFSGQQAFYSE